MFKYLHLKQPSATKKRQEMYFFFLLFCNSLKSINKLAILKIFIPLVYFSRFVPGSELPRYRAEHNGNTFCLKPNMFIDSLCKHGKRTFYVVYSISTDMDPRGRVGACSSWIVYVQPLSPL